MSTQFPLPNFADDGSIVGWHNAGQLAASNPNVTVVPNPPRLRFDTRVAFTITRDNVIPASQADNPLGMPIVMLPAGSHIGEVKTGVYTDVIFDYTHNTIRGDQYLLVQGDDGHDYAIATDAVL